jgi:anti-anti-sigma factor
MIMEIKLLKKPEYAIIEMIGQFWEPKDIIMFEDALEKCIQEGIPVIAADFTRVSFLSSQALGKLVRAYSKMNKAGGHFVLLNPVGSIKETLGIAGITEFMKILDTKEQVAAFAAK